ncbi:uncharacterized protein CTHT_0032640 [Thermochaetoides thermophila DSM 1495]|uniref:4a-hydroxytetrahydrobiopterin dehydratase n=1 Tax=Chaetomium thermophilum (strain DSM 1495 / CBS 144.50 / IMI 039719) TaxID=759272 RepID=G0S587_CHATD|nr:hypothetical protein CTHT_0032640 [Thermochaetoides thermophila DSM 1495]EGS21406.1 hypothetical protein CTHT_0032640 [Thermochaetoides thermophila DSM 1495]
MSTATNPPIPTILSSAAPPSIEPQFSQGTCDDPAELRAALAPLLVENGGRWTLMANGEGLEREFRFKTFARTWPQPQMPLNNNLTLSGQVYNTTFIRWTTHHPKGLSAKDIEMAALCDKLAQEFGEILPADSTTSSTAKTTTTESKPPSAASASTAGADIPSCALSGLANRAAGSAGECCVPKHLQK